jgi:FkbM family methyltransferase
MSVLYFKWLYPGSKVTAFEPDEDAFACLARNVATNHLASVDIHQQALAKREERIPFFYDQDNRGSLTMSTMHERQPKQSREVEAVRLSAHIDGEVDFLKLDVEGAERGVIEELAESWKLRLIKQMAIEYHHHIRGREDALSDFLRILENDGFGYQIGGGMARPLAREVFQDVMVYAYRKN